MKNQKILFLTQAAMIAAVYAVLTLVFHFSSHQGVQVRVAESLTILPTFTPAAIPGLFVGCLVSNILGGMSIADIVFGSLATLIAACFTYLFRKQNKFLAPLPPIIVNMLIIPYVLHYAGGETVPIPVLMLTIGIGQFISCGILGMILYEILKKYKHRIFKTN